MGGTQSQMVWPPVILRTEILGEMRDTSGRNFPRDQGRSIHLGDQIFEIWGDTFCFDDAPRAPPSKPGGGGAGAFFQKLLSRPSGNFVGTTDNCISWVGDRTRPSESTYLTSEARLPQLIPYRREEREVTERHKRENKRIVLWSLGGVIEDRVGCGEGWLFFAKLETHGAECGPGYGMNVARIRLVEGNQVHVQRLENELLFGPDEPHFGHPSSLIDDDGYVYLMGHRDKIEQGLGGLRTVLARVKQGLPMERKNFEYLEKSGRWTRNLNMNNLKDILGHMGHGALFKCPKDASGNHVFGPHGFPYVFVGVDKFLSSNFYLCVADRIDGEWHVENLGPLPKFLGAKSNQRYCLYPHLWASNLERGELMVSWTDNGQMGGMNIMAKVYFKMNPPKK